MKISLEEYQDAADSNQGWCISCKGFTNDFAEPDARNYECDECGKRTVYGAEEALLQELITISE